MFTIYTDTNLLAVQINSFIHHGETATVANNLNGINSQWVVA